MRYNITGFVDSHNLDTTRAEEALIEGFEEMNYRKIRVTVSGGKCSKCGK